MKLRLQAEVTALFFIFFFLVIQRLPAQWLWNNDLALATRTTHGFLAKLTFLNQGKTPLTITGVHFSCPCVTFHFNSTTAAPGKEGTLTIFFEESRPNEKDLDALATGSDPSGTHEFTIRLPETGK